MPDKKKGYILNQLTKIYKRLPNLWNVQNSTKICPIEIHQCQSWPILQSEQQNLFRLSCLSCLTMLTNNGSRRQKTAGQSSTTSQMLDWPCHQQRARRWENCNGKTGCALNTANLGLDFSYTKIWLAWDLLTCLPSRDFLLLDKRTPLSLPK